jgi:hypothetical protein
MSKGTPHTETTALATGQPAVEAEFRHSHVPLEGRSVTGALQLAAVFHPEDYGHMRTGSFRRSGAGS